MYYEDNFNNALPPSQQLPLGGQQMPINGQTTVPNVMMDFPEDQIQKNVPTGGVDQQGVFNGVAQQGVPQPGLLNWVQQTATYDLNVPPFEIEDVIMRRDFFRKVFMILMLQHVIAIPIMIIFLVICTDPLPMVSYVSLWLLGFIIFIVMYIFSDYRRYEPVRSSVLIFTTIYVGIMEGIYATNIGARNAIPSQLLVVLQFLAMILYSKQSRFRFTNLRAISISFFMYILTFLVIGSIVPSFLQGIKFNSAFTVVYCVYDTQLILTGHHGYNIKADEHIFAVGNIYADLPNLTWRLFRYIFLDHFIRLFQFLRKCCFSDVC